MSACFDTIFVSSNNWLGLIKRIKDCWMLISGAIETKQKKIWDASRRLECFVRELSWVWWSLRKLRQTNLMICEFVHMNAEPMSYSDRKDKIQGAFPMSKMGLSERGTQMALMQMHQQIFAWIHSQTSRVSKLFSCNSIISIFVTPIRFQSDNKTTHKKIQRNSRAFLFSEPMSNWTSGCI